MRNNKWILGLVLILTLNLFYVGYAASSVTDVSGTKYEVAVNTLVARGIMSGNDDGTFGPYNNLTRAEAAKILCTANQLNVTGANKASFSDVLESHWASGYISIAQQKGFINGEQDGSFYPERTVTYAEFIKMIVASLGYESPAATLGGYPDGYLSVADKLGYTKDISFQKDDAIIRGDAACILFNALPHVAIYTGSNNIYIDAATTGNQAPSAPAPSATPAATGNQALPPNPKESTNATGENYTSGSGGGCYMPSSPPQTAPPFNYNTEEYSAREENGYMSARSSAVSTFSIDVDTASYSNVRRIINNGSLPTKDAVRIEEMINYFKYDYPQPQGDDPFSINTEVAKCPWDANHNLALINLQGKDVCTDNLPPNNLVFLIDVSGSMSSEDKLPLLIESLKLMVDKMRPQDKISIVVYASQTGVLLDGATGNDKDQIKSVIGNLTAGGSTAGASGIQLAYEAAKKNFIENGNNRVILGTDGDFNVGVSSESELETLIESQRNSGIYLSVLGFGTGNIKDNKMELLADKGNGNYAYIDSMKEAKKVLVEQLVGTLYTIAKDVKIQVEFNPSQVKEYRLIGYENRLLNKEDFNNDAKDAGELGAGLCVTALYEIVPADSAETNATVDDLKYQSVTINPSTELMDVKLRYKEPNATESKLITKSIDQSELVDTISENMAFATAVAEFGLLLEDSEYKEDASYNNVLKRAADNSTNDEDGYKADFLTLVIKAMGLQKQNS